MTLERGGGAGVDTAPAGAALHSPTTSDAPGVAASSAAAGALSTAIPEAPRSQRVAISTARVPARTADSGFAVDAGSVVLDQREDRGSRHPTDGRSSIHFVLLLAVGIIFARVTPTQWLWGWMTLAGAMLLVAVVMLFPLGPTIVRDTSRAVRTTIDPGVITKGALAIVVVALMAAWSVCTSDRIRSDDLARLVSPGMVPTIYRIEGRVRTPPTVREYGDGPMANPWSSRPRTYFQVAVERLHPGPGARGTGAAAVSCSGRVLVRIHDEERRLRIGDTVTLVGVLSPFPPPANPGEPNRAEIAQRQGLAGILSVPGRRAVTIHESSPWADARSAFARWRARLNDRATGWVIRSFPDSEDQRRHALVEAMLLGDRGPALDGLDRSFRRVGLSHVLAISGLHLVVLTFTLVGLVRTFGMSFGITSLFPRRRAANAGPESLYRRGGGGASARVLELVLVVVIVGVYLLIVPARVPVWRAGLTAIVFAAAGLGGRRARSSSLLALAAAALLIWDPDELFEPGFQLSFGIVAAFIGLGTVVDLRLRGMAFNIGIVLPVASRHLSERMPVRPGSAEDAALLAAEEPRSVADFVTLAFWQSLVTSLIAWIVSLPVIAFHFGMLCPLAPIAAVLAMPIVLILLATGYIKALGTVLFPSVSSILGPMLALWADTLIGLVDRLEVLPWAAIALPPPSALWAIVLTILMVWWLRVRLDDLPVERWSRRLAVAAMIAVPFVPRLWAETGLSNVSARVMMLSVGAGGCTLVESGGETFLVDAGSTSVSEVGERIIVPALHRQGINTLDAIIVSHADSDHYNGVLGVIDNIRTRRVILTVTTMINLQERPESAPVLKRLLEEIERRDIPIEVVAAGDTRRIGRARLTWLHPFANDAFAHDNENSAVLRVDLGETRVLFTGDLVDEGLRAMLERTDADEIRADVLEMPHHGAGPDQLIKRLIETVQPKIVLQSATGSRYEDGAIFVRTTEFAGLPAGTPTHFATPEAGAITLIIGRDGTITPVPFREPSARVGLDLQP